MSRISLSSGSPRPCRQAWRGWRRGDLVALIKPQFEAGPGASKDGVIRDSALQEAIANRVAGEVAALGLAILRVDPLAYHRRRREPRIPAPREEARMKPETLTIAAMGARGDGIGAIEGDRVHVPFALPGETVRITREGERGTLLDIVEASADRVNPPCPHFTRCGGCAVQHWAAGATAEWKRERVETAFAARKSRPRCYQRVTHMARAAAG